MSADTETPAAPPAKEPPCKEVVDGVIHLMQGKRHFLVKDYPSAVTAFADACSLLAGKYGELAPECGEPFLCYGKALLELARAEAGVIEMNPSKSDSDEDEEEDGDDEEDKDSKEEDSKEDSDEASKSGEEEASKSGEEEAAKSEEETAKSGEDATKGEEAKSKSTEEAVENGEEVKAESSEGTSNCAGPSKSNEGEEVDDDKEEEEEGDVNNLQLAWEMLESAKIIFLKQVDADANSKDAKLKLAEVLLKLGEVGIESENWSTAIDDLKACLAMQKEVLDEDDRRLAETFYHLAVAYSNNHEFQESIASYEKACAQLQVRIDKLEAKRPNEDTINQVLIDSEVNELKDLLVEMKERLNDTVTEKDEPAPKDDQDEVVQNGSESKPVSNIAHLVRKKPKAEATEVAAEAKVEKTEGETRKRKSEDEETAAVKIAQKKAKAEAES